MKNSLIWQYNGMGFRESGLREGWSLLKRARPDITVMVEWA